MQINKLINQPPLKTGGNVDKKSQEVNSANSDDKVSLTGSKTEMDYTSRLKELASNKTSVSRDREYENFKVSGPIIMGIMCGLSGAMLAGLGLAAGATANEAIGLIGGGLAIGGCLPNLIGVVTSPKETDKRQALSILLGGLAGGGLAIGLGMGGGTAIASAAVGGITGAIIKSKFFPTPPDEQRVDYTTLR